ncbi:endonuclease/exonuclease/phosphatase family protein [Maribacter sp. 2307ULW6-5]|uniref:endonuclease/exonuclease/phosphatase family protein n=1 Tax=Maribacter sp. 2307ULW6-5 TaxID=3386275 RepID=UPI0039BD88B5
MMYKMFLRVLNLFRAIAAVLLLLACGAPHTGFAEFAFLGLAVPLLVILNILSVVYWLFVERKLAWLNMIALVLGYWSLGTFVKFGREVNTVPSEGLSVMSFNVQAFGMFERKESLNLPDDIAAFVKEEDPDIIGLQEFSRVYHTKFSHYPFKSLTAYSEGRNTQAIFSKYPIVGEGSLRLPDTSNNAIYADVLYQGDTLRIYNIHLQSLAIRPGSIKREQSTKLFGRLRYSFTQQQEQAQIIRDHANASPYPVVFCADMNNNQFSRAYHLLKGNKNDSFMEKGRGYGRTLSFSILPFRIDFILADPKFEVLSHKNYAIGLSDHEPVMALLRLGGNK